MEDFTRDAPAHRMNGWSAEAAWGWARPRLFAGPVSAAVTLVCAALIVFVLWSVVDWAFINAVWSGEGPKACPPANEGACWIFVSERMKLYLSGFYPPAELWRPILAAVLLVPAAIPILAQRVPARRQWLWFSLAYPVIAFFLLHGLKLVGMDTIPSSRWGGFMLTMVVGVTGMVFSLPLGILLALARRSELPAIRLLATGFIELIRAVPLITLLFMASVMLPLFAPAGFQMDKLLRALIIVALFAAAYMAEVIRGGLQAIPRGQGEAADALGLGYWQSMRLIVLPQALRISIPGIVNTYIGLFKDTTLVSIIGLMDILGIADSALQDPDWLGRPGGMFREDYAFVALIFWVFCFAMSRYATRLERRLAHEESEAR
jgi:general L-amino acid transport system permease protein